jgi:Mor family transcriptional regulator
LGEKTLILEILRQCIATSTDADDAIKKIQTMIGAGSVYIPNEYHKHIKERHEQILEYYTGDNFKETCQVFDISSSTLFRLLRKQKNPGKNVG